MEGCVPLKKNVPMTNQWKGSESCDDELETC